MSTYPGEPAALLKDRYRLIREIGRGASAVVFLAEDTQRQVEVAVKILQEERAAAVGADRFLREIEIIRRLDHPCILPLLDSGEDGGLFLVMPLVSGGTLRTWLERER